MRRLLALVLLCAPLAAQNADDRPCRSDYTIRARYEEDGRKLHGELTVRWTNDSRDTVPDLWFHAYWNAFANSETTHMVGSGGTLRGGPVGDDEWGWQRILSVSVDDVDVTPSLEWTSPDDQRAEDRTVFRVRMPRAVKPGEVVSARVRWEARVPRVRRRTGYKDDFLFMAQWFPKLGVYETGNGWNCHQFHAATEFFSNFGTYDVELDLPSVYQDRTGASGVQDGPTTGGKDRFTVRYAAPSDKDRERAERSGRSPLVHDFAWTADRHYVKYEGTFHFDEWAARFPDEVTRVALALDRTQAEMRLRDVAVTVLLQPEHASQGSRHFEATCTALFFYGLWWGEYPYEHITCVDPAWGGGGAGGMEYPTLFTAGTRMFTRAAMQSPESVTVHEAGHQFWYGLVANNEFEASWLDEGFNTFTQNDALWLRYGHSIATTDFASVPYDGVPIGRKPGGSAIADALAGKRFELPWIGAIEPLRGSGLVDWWREQPLLSYGRQRTDPRDGERVGYLQDPDTDPVDMPAWLYCDRASYRTNSYRRTATALRSLQGLVGDARFLRGMRTYSERWRYRHPYPQDFIDAFQEGAKADIGWFFEQAFRSTATVDWRIEVEQERAKRPRGWFADETGHWIERKKGAEGSAKAKPEVDEDVDGAGTETAAVVADTAPAGPAGWRTQVVVRRRGEMLLPLTVELNWDDGTSERVVWAREDQARSTWWKPLEGRAPGQKKLVSAKIDPDHRYAFDLDLSNNEWHDAVDRAAPLRWSERVFAQYLHGLHAWGGLGG
ncbi:MAG: M1 family metallopeptidase [Planctomycetota bacterium]|nr:M1 family metallopeptidase [Planctomycetota bacterium]